MKYSHILTQFDRHIWAILEEKYAVMKAFLQLKASGGSVSADEIALIKKAKRSPYLLEAAGDAFVEVPCDHPEPCGYKHWAKAAAVDAAAAAARTKDGSTIAVLPLTGTISHRMGMISEISGGISTERFTQWLRAAAADPSVKAIVIDADSPGGTVDGVPELADEIYRTNKAKTVVGVANSMAASAAYWLLSQCGELAITPSGSVGSIGVFASHEDVSKMYENYGVKVSLISAGKYKTEGNPYEPLSDDARQSLQSAVNDYYDLFTKAVARGRASDQKTVKAGFGEGRMLTAQQAVKEGMADRVATLDQTLAKMGANPSGSKAALAGLAIRADEQDGDGPDDEDIDDILREDECECTCEACQAGNCAECSNEECDEENCEHAESAAGKKGAAAPEVPIAAETTWQQKLAARRRRMQMI